MKPLLNHFTSQHGLKFLPRNGREISSITRSGCKTKLGFSFTIQFQFLVRILIWMSKLDISLDVQLNSVWTSKLDSSLDVQTGFQFGFGSILKFSCSVIPFGLISTKLIFVLIVWKFYLTCQSEFCHSLVGAATTVSENEICTIFCVLLCAKF